MLERSFDTDFINRVINDPAVRPFIGLPDIGYVDAKPAVGQDENWFLMDEHGGFWLAWSAPKVREVHTFILPDGRGAWGANRRKQMLEYAKKNGVRTLWTKIPPGIKHVERFARQGGMKPTGDVLKTFGIDYRIFCMEL